ncbi:MAG: alpha/beta fold hydrolase [Candidatus Thorarchaeota archaeon]
MPTQERLIVFILVFSLVTGGTSLLFSLVARYPQRMAQPPLESEYETTFWDLSEAINGSVSMEVHSVRIQEYMHGGHSVRVVETSLSYLSNLYRGEAIRVGGLMLHRENISEPQPSVLLLHGYGSQSQDFGPILWDLALEGYVVMAIDAPGCGRSTGPALSPLTFLNVTDGPTSAHLYYSTWAAARAVTLLESLPFVRPEKTFVLGVSMGAIEAIILTAVDRRIDGVIPTIAAGNLRNALLSGSLLNSLIDPSYTIDGPEIASIIRYFDPIAYVRLIEVPVLMMFGTGDEFFPLLCFSDTVEHVKAPLTLSISPNFGHVFVSIHVALVKMWLNWLTSGDDVVPQISISHTEVSTPVGVTIRVYGESPDGVPLYLYWRSGMPGSSWSVIPMTLMGGRYTAEIFPLTLADILFFVSTSPSDSLAGFTTRVLKASGGSYLVPVVVALSTLGLTYVILRDRWSPSLHDLWEEVPTFIGAFMIIIGFVAPFFNISGRADIQLTSFVETYGTLFMLNDWLLPSVVGTVCMVVSISLFRRGLSLKIMTSLWLPLLFVFTMVHLMFVGFFSFHGAMGMVHDGAGSYLLLLSVPVVLLLEVQVKKSSVDVLIGPEDIERLVNPASSED